MLFVFTLICLVLGAHSRDCYWEVSGGECSDDCGLIEIDLLRLVVCQTDTIIGPIVCFEHECSDPMPDRMVTCPATESCFDGIVDLSRTCDWHVSGGDCLDTCGQIETELLRVVVCEDVNLPGMVCFESECHDPIPDRFVTCPATPSCIGECDWHVSGGDCLDTCGQIETQLLRVVVCESVSTPGLVCIESECHDPMPDRFVTCPATDSCFDSLFGIEIRHHFPVSIYVVLGIVGALLCCFLLICFHCCCRSNTKTIVIHKRAPERYKQESGYNMA